ncbi:hypothetical protein D3C72_332490 [compost metagenome]
MTRTMTTRSLSAGNFFLLRTPLLPTAAGWTSEVAPSIESDPVLASPLFQEALFLSSETVFEKLQDGASTDARLDKTVTRYRRRMATRCTPFGTSAAVTVGCVGADTAIILTRPGDARRTCRLDQGVVQKLLNRAHASAFGDQPSGLLNANTSAWRAADGYRYIEMVVDHGVRRYRLSRIAASPAVDAAMALYRSGERLELSSAATSLSTTLGSSYEAAQSFLLKLAENQLLIMGPEATASTDDAVVRLLQQLRVQPWAEKACSDLAAVHDLVGTIGDDPTTNIERYRAIKRYLAEADLEIETGKILHVDLHRPPMEARLSKASLGRLARALWDARAVLSRPSAPMAKFSEAFTQKYGDREISLLEALDVDFGIPFGGLNTDTSPLIAPFRFDKSTPKESDPLEALVWKRLTSQADGSPERSLDLTEYARERATGRSFVWPSSFSVIGICHGTGLEAWSAGQGLFEPKQFRAPAMSLFGRFCNGNSELTTAVRAFVSAHEEDRDDLIHAELVHLPYGRTGNVVLRPNVRDYEMTYMSASERPTEFQIPISDLSIRVVDGEIQLFSRPLGKRIIPRLTSAHNTNSPTSLPIYRFLGALQLQGVQALGWAWGETLTRLPFLPRVTCGSLLLSRARWRLSVSDFEPGLEGLRAGLAALGVPNHVAICVTDNFVEVRLDRADDLEVLLEELRRHKDLILTEAFDDEDLITDATGSSYRQEFMIPFVAEQSSPPSGATATSAGGAEAADRHWLYAQVFAGPATLEHIVAALYPGFLQIVDQRGGRSPFFIRYNEDGWHLRLRARFETSAGKFAAMHDLELLLKDLLASRRAHRLRFDDYVPETMRYGGPALIARYEAAFAEDSLAVSRGLATFSRRADAEELRWKFAALSIGRMLQDLLPDEAHRVKVARAFAESYAVEFSATKTQKDLLKTTYRKNKLFFDQVADLGAVSDDRLSGAIAAVNQRTQSLTAMAPGLQEGLSASEYMRAVSSLLHMTANRIFLEGSRPHEFVIFSCLEKSLRSTRARTASRRLLGLAAGSVGAPSASPVAKGVNPASSARSQ